MIRFLPAKIEPLIVMNNLPIPPIFLSITPFLLPFRLFYSVKFLLSPENVTKLTLFQA